MRRYLAHRIIYKGECHHLAVAAIADDGSVSVSPYCGETHSTVFVAGTLDLDKMAGISRQNRKISAENL